MALSTRSLNRVQVFSFFIPRNLSSLVDDGFVKWRNLWPRNCQSAALVLMVSLVVGSILLYGCSLLQLYEEHNNICDRWWPYHVICRFYIISMYPRWMGRGNIMSSCTRRYCDPLVTQATRRPPEEHSRFWLIRNDVAGREEGESRGGSSFESAQDHNARADMNAHPTDRLVPSLAFKYHFRHNYLARPFIHLTHLHWLILQSLWMARMKEGWLTDWCLWWWTENVAYTMSAD